jgi:hypothetical protein
MIGMHEAILNSMKKSNLLIYTALLTVNLIGNFPAFSATPPQHQASERYISQNVVSDTAKLETIYVSQEGVNLGWIIRINNSVVAVDASGSLMAVLNGEADNKSGGTVEYYTSGTERGKLKRIGNTYFQYYITGKIGSIGNLDFQYHNTGTIEKGRIKSIGKIYFQYFDAGKYGVRVRSIGNVYFTYNNIGTIESISGNQPEASIQTTSIEQWRVLMGVASEPSSGQLQPMFPSIPY